MTAPAIIGGFSEDRLEARKTTLGASEIAAVAGLSPYQSALDVYLVKRGIVPAFKGNEFTEWGNRLEEVIASKYADVHGVLLKPSDTIISPDEPWMSATPDRIAQPEISPAQLIWGVECKNRGARMAHQWGDSGTDLVPMDVAAQCHWSMIVTGLQTWDVAVLIGGCEFRWYRLAFDSEIADALQEKGHEFWFRYVEKGIEPPVDGSASWSDYLKKKFARHTEQLREAGVEEYSWIRELVAAREKRKEIEAGEAVLENRLKNLIGETSGIVAPDGSKVTWKASKPTAAIDWQGIAEDLLRHQAPEVKDALVTAHTKEKPGARRFLISVPKGV